MSFARPQSYRLPTKPGKLFWQFTQYVPMLPPSTASNSGWEKNKIRGGWAICERATTKSEILYWGSQNNLAHYETARLFLLKIIPHYTWTVVSWYWQYASHSILLWCKWSGWFSTWLENWSNIYFPGGCWPGAGNFSSSHPPEVTLIRPNRNIWLHFPPSALQVAQEWFLFSMVCT